MLKWSIKLYNDVNLPQLADTSLFFGPRPTIVFSPVGFDPLIIDITDLTARETAWILGEILSASAIADILRASVEVSIILLVNGCGSVCSICNIAPAKCISRADFRKLPSNAYCEQLTNNASLSSFGVTWVGLTSSSGGFWSRSRLLALCRVARYCGYEIDPRKTPTSNPLLSAPVGNALMDGCLWPNLIA